MICPKCNAKMEPGDAFCQNCGSFTLSVDDKAYQNEDSVREAPKKIYPDTEFIPSAEPVAVRQDNKKLKRLCVLFGIVAVIATILSIVLLATSGTRKAQLRKAQSDAAAAQTAVAELEAQITELNTSMDSYRGENDALNQQVTSLTGQVNNMETSVNQSQYDKEAAQRDLENAEAELKTLGDTIAELQKDLKDTQLELTVSNNLVDDLTENNDVLTRERNELKATNEGLEKDLAFYETYIVFVLRDDENRYYHNKDCPDFTPSGFYAYNTKLAESNGYVPCPNCR